MSRNGRHRRPRQAPALLVAAGVAGSAIVIPLLGAGGASAADGSTWDNVAECESGGAWSADLGNGYYGGLQMSQQTWDEFGGGEYASRPDLASRAQQIAVAEKVFEAQGAEAWSSCAAVSGLTEALGDAVSGLTEVPPSSAGSADPEGAASSAPDDGASAYEDEQTPDDAATPSASETPESGVTGSTAGSGADSSGSSSASGGSGGSASPSASASDRADGGADVPTGRHRGAAADESATGGSDKGRASGGGHTSRDAGSGRDESFGDAVSRDIDKAVTEVDNHLSLSSGGDKVVGGWV
jgi:resuscitation-promoting factor RpfA